MSSSTSGAADVADDDAVFEDAKEEVEVDQVEVGASMPHCQPRVSRNIRLVDAHCFVRIVTWMFCSRKIKTKEKCSATTVWR